MFLTGKNFLFLINLLNLLNNHYLYRYEDLELFKEIEPSDLDYLGIVNVDHRAKLLTAVQLLHDMDCKFTIYILFIFKANN